MILNLLGLRRVVILAFLLGANVVLFLFTNTFFTPSIDKNARALSRVEREVKRYRSDLNALRTDFDQLGGQQEIFNRLTERRFFGDVPLQVQLKALEDLQEQTGVEAIARISGATNVTLKGLDRVAWLPIKRDVEIEVTALDDVDIYRYIDRVQDIMPGYLKLKNITVRRNLEFNADILRAIVRGQFPGVLSAKIVFEWYLMTPTAGASAPSANTAGGGR